MAYLITTSCKGCAGCTYVCPPHAIQGKRRSLHHVDSAICIDCGACGRICPAGAVQTPAGETALRLPRAEWLQPLLKMERCTLCGACIQACLTSSWGWQKPASGEGAAYPALLRPAKCIGCGFCANVCSAGALEMEMPGHSCRVT